MTFIASNMYCKYVIKTLSNSIKKLINKNDCDELLENKLYEAYIKLEKLLNIEII